MYEKAAEEAMISLGREVRRDPETWVRKRMPLLESKSGGIFPKDVLRVQAVQEKMAC